jgi:hypothetical protein
MSDETLAQIGRERFVVGEAGVGPHRVFTVALRVEQHERCVPFREVTERRGRS